MRCLTPVQVPNPLIDKTKYNVKDKHDYLFLKMKFKDKVFIEVPCGHCEACVERKSNEWATRIYNEWILSDTAQFFTLTYAEDFLPINPVRINYGYDYEEYETPVLCKRDVQLFMKRLRKKLGNGLKFFLGGEYGEQGGRPHYHFILFNYPKKYEDELTDIVAKCWSYGFVTSGETNIRRIMYVAKYIYSASMLPRKGVENFVKPFILASRRPAIGSSYCNDINNIKYHNETLETVVTIDDGKVMPMPRYYRGKIFSDESKEVLLNKFLTEEHPKPTESEIRVFLKRFKQKKKAKKL